MVISITLTYRMALLERAAKGAFVRTLSGLCIGTPRDFHANAFPPNDLARSLRSRWIIENTRKSDRDGKTTFEEFVLVSLKLRHSNVGARGAPQTIVPFFFLFHIVDIADRKGKLNSPVASAEILSLASERIYNAARGTVARSADGSARDRARARGGKKRRGKKVQT